MRVTRAKAKTTACLLFVAVALSTGAQAFAQSLIEGPEFRVNASKEGPQREPAVATSPNSDFVVVWESRLGYSTEIVAQGFDPRGRREGDEIVVGPSGFRARAAIDGGGNSVVKWEGSSATYLQRFDRWGLPQGEVIENVGSPTGGDVEMLDDGSFVTVFCEYGNVTAQRFDRRGQPIGGTIEVGSDHDGWFPGFSMSSTGEFVVAWSVGYQTGWYGATGSGILAQRFDRDGSAIGGPITVSSARRSHGRAAVAMDSDGSFVVAWSASGRGSDDVFVRRFDGTGAPIGGEFVANSYTPHLQNSADLAIAPDGSFVVAWRSYGQDGDGDGVFAQAFDRQGVRFGTEFQVSSYTLGHQTSPSVAFDPTSRLIVAWHTDPRDGDDADVFAKLYRLDGIVGPDGDGDGVEDVIDNCPQVPNADQSDDASDGLGDACVAPGAVIHPSARLGDNPLIGRGTVIGAGVLIGDDAQIGEEVRFDRQARAGDRLRVGDRAVVGSRASLGSDVAIGADSRVDSAATIGDATTIGDGVVIGRNVSIATRATIGPLVVLEVGARVGRGATVEMGARVGRRAVVLAGAVVPAGTTVPAGTRFR